jgi:transcriptional regulator with XRE-family HTH domain
VTVGELLRQWRRRRGLSQLALAGAAGVSARHLSFVETGRSRPSRALLLRLGEHLDVPLRDRNALLLAAGLAPAYPQHRLDDPPMAAVADAVARILAAYEPYPALVVDRRWELVDANPPGDVTVAELAIEAFLPADDTTAEALAAGLRSPAITA